MGWLDRFRAPAKRGDPSVPDGMRVYAVGDIHGRYDLLDAMIAMIGEDCADFAGEAQIVFLGDYVDRGPESARVIERLASDPPGFATCRFLAGNHEEAMLGVLSGDRDELEGWLSWGGIETLESYGIDRREIAAGGVVLDSALTKVPESHRAFLQALEDTIQIGDYVFVHAGIRPRVALDRQCVRDLRWIREEFLHDDSDHGFVVVHGHTIAADVDVRPNRIGIDTGAYRTGKLTALALEGTQRWLLETG